MISVDLSVGYRWFPRISRRGWRQKRTPEEAIVGGAYRRPPVGGLAGVLGHCEGRNRPTHGSLGAAPLTHQDRPPG